MQRSWAPATTFTRTPNITQRQLAQAYFMPWGGAELERQLPVELVEVEVEVVVEVELELRLQLQLKPRLCFWQQEHAH